MGCRCRFVCSALLAAVLSYATGLFYLNLLPWGYLLLRAPRAVFRALITFPRDLNLITVIAKVLIQGKLWEKRGFSVPRVFTETASRYPDRIALRHLDRKFTYREVEEYSNRVANYFKSLGYDKGDVVCVFLESRPEYPMIWLGLSKIGVVSALVNTNQKGKALQHSIDIVKSKAMIYGTELSPALEELKESLGSQALFSTGEGGRIPGSTDLDSELKNASAEPVTEDIMKQKLKDKVFYIYTSGTTGLPKAAIITHGRCLFMMHSIKCASKLTKDDIVYTPLPLYHTAGGVLGMGTIVLTGGTVVLKTKFSVSKFWDDCIKYDCTIAQYIGEMCRYLLAQPESAKDRAHKVRMMYGNGLRPQIWQKFVERFNIKDICEFYGATESNSNMFNNWNKIGSVGYIPWFVSSVYPVSLVKVDDETNEPVRGPDGLCVECRTGEPGLLVGKIDPSRVITNFAGYADDSSTKKKILKDVFKRGDMFFNSGDILVRDELNYFYFKDRTGDTFRWRGENVATSEVEAIISNIISLKDCVVYGVEIPNIEGRAGMAAVLDEAGVLDLSKLEAGLEKSLPPFARPIFLRVMSQLPMTGTYKLKKVDLVKESYDPGKISDPLYFMDLKSGKFMRLTEELHKDIVEGRIRL